MHTLEAALGKQNNFDALRLLASIGVVLSHAYPVTQGSNANEFLFLISGGQVTLGEVCVMVFFVISGFFITQSFSRSATLIDYLSNRIIRIVPALAVVVFMACAVMGPIVTTSSGYWLSHSTYRYLGNIFIYPSSQNLTGVFDANVYPSVINASLWTLCYEFSFYAGLAAIGLSVRKAWKPAILMTIFTFASVFYTYISPVIFIQFSSYFFAGGVFYLLRKHVVLDGRLLLTSVVVLGCALFLKSGFHVAFFIFGAYLIIHLAHSKRLRMHECSRFGDFSYGVYIYAFPIQQLLAPYTASAFANFLCSMPLVLICAICSWHFIEKPVLSRKQKIAKFIRAFCLRCIGGTKESGAIPPSRDA